jgi:hypothetical protein
MAWHAMAFSAAAAVLLLLLLMMMMMMLAFAAETCSRRAGSVHLRYRKARQLGSPK